MAFDSGTNKNPKTVNIALFPKSVSSVSSGRDNLLNLARISQISQIFLLKIDRIK